MATQSPRLAALTILNSVERDGAYANLSLRSSFSDRQLSGVDKALLIQLVYGSITYRISLDYLLNQQLKRPLDSLPLPIRNILRLGAYQILYLDKIPARSAVDEAVKLAHRFGHRGTAGLVNAVLRKLTSQESIKWPDRDTDLVAHLSVKHAHPAFMVRRWLCQLGEKETEALLVANNRVPELCVRVNTLKTTPEDLTRGLQSKGIAVTSGLFTPWNLYLNPAPPFSDELFRSGQYIVQGESSTLVGLAVKPAAGETVADLCAAPGGKTTHLAELMGNTGQVFAFDVNPQRLSMVADNAKRLGISTIKLYAHPMEQAPELIPAVDRVLLDAPCSGLGVIRHKPDIRHSRSEQDIGDLAALQKNLISSAARLVKPGGRLVYSVCTMEPEETTEVVRSLLSSNQEFHICKPPQEFSDIPQTDNYGYHFWPHRHGIDGFYVAIMERRQEKR